MIQIKLFEAEHEIDLEDEINEFLCELDEKEFVDLRYSSSHFMEDDQQIYSFSACILYRIENNKKGTLLAGRK